MGLRCMSGIFPTSTISTYAQSSSTRISKDELDNLHEIAYDTPRYVHKISTFPDLVDLQEILDEADEVLMLQEEGELLHTSRLFN